MNIVDVSLVGQFASAVEAFLGGRVNDRLLEAAVAAARGEIAVVPEPGESPLVAALAAAALASAGAVSVHVATTYGSEAERIAAAVNAATGNSATVRCATVESFALEYLKGGVVTRDIALVVPAEQILLRDANTPVVLCRSSEHVGDAIPAWEVADADRLLQRDRDYIIQEGEIIARDPETGALFPGRRFSGGFHTAVRQREGLPPEGTDEPLARITVAEYLRLYPRLGGIATTPDARFSAEYGLSVTEIPGAS